MVVGNWLSGVCMFGIKFGSDKLIGCVVVVIVFLMFVGVVLCGYLLVDDGVLFVVVGGSWVVLMFIVVVFVVMFVLIVFVIIIWL